jgi:hypothetical protein
MTVVLVTHDIEEALFLADRSCYVGATLGASQKFSPFRKTGRATGGIVLARLSARSLEILGLSRPSASENPRPIFDLNRDKPGSVLSFMPHADSAFEN